MTSPGLAPGPLPPCGLVAPQALHSCQVKSYASARQAEDALCDDVRLDLGGAAGDGADARPQERLLPAPAAGGRRELGMRAEELQRQVVQALRQVGPEELHQRGFRARLLPALEAREGTAVHEAHDLDVDPPARHFLAGVRLA